MKNWIGRLLGGAEKETATPAAIDAAAVANSKDMAADLDAAYYRWLAASRGTNASPDIEQQILDAVRALADDPESAAGLVPRGFSLADSLASSRPSAALLRPGT